jgi:hypothetical protein
MDRDRDAVGRPDWPGCQRSPRGSGPGARAAFGAPFSFLINGAGPAVLSSLPAGGGDSFFKSAMLMLPAPSGPQPIAGANTPTRIANSHARCRGRADKPLIIMDEVPEWIRSFRPDLAVHADEAQVPSGSKTPFEAIRAGRYRNSPGETTTGPDSRRSEWMNDLERAAITGEVHRRSRIYPDASTKKPTDFSTDCVAGRSSRP